MVYIKIYDEIWDFINSNEDLVEDLRRFVVKQLGKDVYDLEPFELAIDLILERSLFMYIYNSKLLLEFVKESIYSDLSIEDKKLFDDLYFSKRKNYTYISSELGDDRDEFGNVFLKHKFLDMVDEKEVVVNSAIDYSQKEKDINFRLIREYVKNDGSYFVIGVFLEKHIPEEHLMLQNAFFNIGRDLNRGKSLLSVIKSKSEGLSFDEIDSFVFDDDKYSDSIDGIRTLMKLSKKFYDKFGLGLFDFLGNVFVYSNLDNFEDMCLYYFDFANEMDQIVMDIDLHSTGNIFFGLFPIFEGFLYFVVQDVDKFKKSYESLVDFVEQEYEVEKEDGLSFSKENIVKFQTKNLRNFLSQDYLDSEKKIISDKLDELEKIDLKDIDLFLVGVYNFYAHNKKFLEKYFGDVDEFLFGFRELYFDKDLLCREEIEKDFEVFDSDSFFDFISVPSSVYDLCVLMRSYEYYVHSDYKRAYDVVKAIDLDVVFNDSFVFMFYIGKVFSLNDDLRYKKYFKVCKKMDKERYKEELNSFLEGEKKNG